MDPNNKVAGHALRDLTDYGRFERVMDVTGRRLIWAEVTDQR